jgi:hypothetical protein
LENPLPPRLLRRPTRNLSNACVFAYFDEG